MLGAVAIKDEAVGERSSLMNKNADLSLEVDRKIRLATQAIAARHEIMEELTVAKVKVQHAAYEQERLSIQVKKAMHEKEEY